MKNLTITIDADKGTVAIGTPDESLSKNDFCNSSAAAIACLVQTIEEMFDKETANQVVRHARELMQGGIMELSKGVTIEVKETDHAIDEEETLHETAERLGLDDDYCDGEGDDGDTFGRR